MKKSNKAKQRRLIENEKKYKEATARFEEIREAPKDTPEYKEMLLLVQLVSAYEEKKWSLPDVGPAEVTKIRMEEFGYRKTYQKRITPNRSIR